MKTYRVDASKFQGKLDTLARTMTERFKDEWPTVFAHLPFAQLHFLLALRYSRSVFRVVCGMCSDERRADYRWNWEQILVLPSTNRTLLDVLANSIFILENPEQNLSWYVKAAWWEQKREYERFKAEYGARPEWTEWLESYAKLLQRGVREFGMTDEEQTNPKAIPYWPTPGKMPQYETSTEQQSDDRRFLQYLYDWYYRDHSAQAHMSFLGQMKLGSILVLEDLDSASKDDMQNNKLPRLMTSHVSRSAFLLLSLISEFQHRFKFSGNLELRILEIWHVLIAAFPEAREIFERRYDAYFPALVISKE